MALQKSKKLPPALYASQFGVEFIGLDCLCSVEDVGTREIVVLPKFSIQAGSEVILSRDLLT